MTVYDQNFETRNVFPCKKWLEMPNVRAMLTSYIIIIESSLSKERENLQVQNVTNESIVAYLQSVDHRKQ